LGARPVKRFRAGCGFSTNAKKQPVDSHSRGVIENALNVLSPLSLNRIDDVIIFNSLGEEEIFKIIDIELGLFIWQG